MKRALTSLQLLTLTAVSPGVLAAEPKAEDVDAASTPAEVSQTILGTIETMWNSFVGHLPYIGLAMVSLFLTWGAAKLLDKFSHKLVHMFGVEKGMEDALTRIIVAMTWFIGILLTAMILFPGLSPVDALAAMGAGSIAIGFAFKDIFENLFAGIMMMAKMPFEVGDLIEVEDTIGRVEKIDLRETHLRTLDGQLVLVPNGKIYTNKTVVKTQEPLRRVTVMCGVGYDEDLDEAIALVKETVEGCEGVESSKPVQIFAQGFGSSSMDFEVTWWTGSEQLDVRQSRHAVVTAVKRALDKAGIEIPFPYRTHTFSGPIPVVQHHPEGSDGSQDDSPPVDGAHKEGHDRAA